MTTRIKLRRDTYQNWYDNNPTLALGEPAYDTTNNQVKIGDGTTAWRALDPLTAALGDLVVAGSTITSPEGVHQDLVLSTVDTGPTEHLWTFGTDGKLTLPGNLVIAGNTSVFGTDAALIQATDDKPLLSLSSGANGAVSSLWVEDIGNVGTSNIAAVYANPTPGSKIVRIAVGQNGGGAGPNLWDFGTDGNLTLPGNETITDTKVTNWDTAYEWGDHSIAGYVTGTPWTGEGYVTGTPWTGEGYVTGTPWTGEGYLTAEADTLDSVTTRGNSTTNDITVGNLTVSGLTFSDDTVQTTSYQKVAVPAHSYGVAGDKTGMLAFDASYIYYCTADYSISNGIASVTISTPIPRDDSLHWDPATTVIQFGDVIPGGVAATGTPVFDGSGDLTGINIDTAGSGYLRVADGGSSNVTDIFIIQTGGTGGNSTREIRNGLPAAVTINLTTTDIWKRTAHGAGTW